MVVSKKDKILIESLRETKGYGTLNFLNCFRRKNWTKGGLDSLITC